LRELLRDCDELEHRVNKRTSESEVPLAELERAEQTMDGMRRRFREIKRRDVFHAPSAGSAGMRLKQCEKLLGDLAERVYGAGRAR